MKTLLNPYDIISELDRYGNYIFINKNSEIITGFTLAELFNSKFEHLIKDTQTKSTRFLWQCNGGNE
jgi:hypothetical protein